MTQGFEPELLREFLARPRSWRAPPNWSLPDWHEEVGAVGAAAAWQAICEFDPGAGVSLHHFARSRVHSRCLARYRQEWAFGRRFVPEGALTESWAAAVAAGGGSGRGEVEAGAEHCQDTLVVREALACLPAAQQWLVRELFWGGRSEAELASELGISRRAVNKRKQRALSSLQGHV